MLLDATSTRDGLTNGSGMWSRLAAILALISIARNDELSRILERVVEIGLRGGWAEFEGTPLALPQIQLTRPHPTEDASQQTDKDSGGST